MAHLSVKIDDDLDERIVQEQDRYPYEIDRSQIVRAALDEYLPELEEGNKTKATPATA